MKFAKDIYLKIACIADDETSIRMLTANKRYNTEEHFKQLLKIKYPFLAELKELEEQQFCAYSKYENYKIKSWKRFYIEQGNCIRELWERYKFPYVHVISYDPKYLLNYISNSDFADSEYHLDSILLNHYSQAGDLKNVIAIMKKHDYNVEKEIYFGILSAVKGNCLKVIKYFLENIKKLSIQMMGNLCQQAAILNKVEILQYFIEIYKTNISSDLQFFLNRTLTIIQVNHPSVVLSTEVWNILNKID